MDGTQSLKLGMGGFVDDSGCNVNCRPEDEHSLVDKATLDAQLWSNILWASGGEREHSKCSYQYLQTEFMPSGKPFFRGGKFGKPILISDRNKTISTLKHLSAYAPFKTLGTYQAATHGQKKQFEVLQEKASNLCRTLALSHCSANAAWLFYSSIFMKSVGYPLSVSRLTCRQLRTLQGPMVSITLNRMHYSKRTARVLVYGPRYYGGLELGTLQLVQGAGKIILLIRHLRTLGQPHDLLLIVLDRIQYIAGVGFHILEDTKSSIPHLEGIWLPTARDYLGQMSGSRLRAFVFNHLRGMGINISWKWQWRFQVFPLDTKNDKLLRLYLQVLTLSDICNAEGTQLVAGMSQGNRNRDQSYSILEEPLQERPNAVSWGIWRRFLQHMCYDKYRLSQPLGPWYARLSTRRRWPCYYIPGHDIIQVLQADGT
jgi:hypothetical protein